MTTNKKDTQVKTLLGYNTHRHCRKLLFEEIVWDERQKPLHASFYDLSLSL